MSWCLRLQNVVGYTSKDIKNAIWMAVPVQFQNPGDAANLTQVSFIEYFDCTDLVPGQFGTYGELLSGAPVAQIPKENTACGYTKYYFINDAYEEDGMTPHEGACWADEYGTVLPASAKVTLGKGFWFRAKCAGASRTNAGQVLDGDTATLTPKAGVWVMLASPFPTAASLATAATTGLTAGSFGNYGELLSGAPVIQVPKENTACGYDKYYYINDAYEQDGMTPHTGDCWADEYGTVLSGDQIPVGKSAWFRTKTNTDTPSITLAK